MKWLLTVLALAAGFALAAQVGANSSSRVLGDADCSTRITSLDAALTLQYAAALTTSLPCQKNADVDGNSGINSIDANLELQISAGLIPGFVRMRMVIDQASACDGSSCTFPSGSDFRVSVLLEGLPERPYIAFQSFVFVGRLDFMPAVDVADEILWPDGGFPLRTTSDPGPAHGAIGHADATSVLAPYSESTYSGELVTLEVGCPAQAGTYPLHLISHSERETRGSGIMSFRTPQQATGDRIVYSMPFMASLDLDLDNRDGIEPDERDIPVAQTITVHCE